MMNKKKEEDTIVLEEKRKQFIREQVRPQRKKQMILWMKRFGILVGAAVIFGGIAGGVIVCIQNYLVKEEGNASEISAYASHFPELENSPEADASAEEMDKDEELPQITLNQLNRVTRRMAAIGSGMNASLVGIKSTDRSGEWLAEEYSGQRVEYGLLIQESRMYYYILTTSSIVQRQKSVIVQLIDETTVVGEVQGSDMRLNMAVVRINKSELSKNLQSQMAVAQLGAGSGINNGTNVIAVGCPNGVLKSVVIGRITNDSIKASVIDGEVQLYCTDMPYTEQANGVVLDTRGRVVGILTTNFTEKTGMTGLSFIKMSGVAAALELLQANKSAPYLGIEGVSLSVTAAKAHQLEMGAYVTEVYAGSPAYDGGMRVADVITKVDGETISGMADIYRQLLKKKPGDAVTYTVVRKSGSRQFQKKFNIKLG